MVSSTVIIYSTAFEIALNEFQKGRITADELDKVAKSILAETNKEKIFPQYSICPNFVNACNTVDAKIAKTCEKVIKHLSTFCLKKN